MHLHHNLMALAAAGAIFLAPATSFADAASEAAQMAATPVQATDDSAAAQSAVGMPNPMVPAAMPRVTVRPRSAPSSPCARPWLTRPR